MRRGSNLQDLALSNRSLILRLIRAHGQMSRAELSKLTGLTEASISKITREMVERGILVEEGYGHGAKGRRTIMLRIKSESFHVIGVRVSRREFAVGLFDLSGSKIYSMRQTISEDISGDELQGAIDAEIERLIGLSDEIKAVGIAVPGPFIKAENSILLMTGMRSFRRLELKRDHASPVPRFYSHDANAGVLADWIFSDQALEKGDVLVHYLVGEGVGAGVLVEGRILEGTQGTAAEIGHMSLNVHGERCHCGNYGCLELYASSIAFAQQAVKQRAAWPNSLLWRYSEITHREVFEAARDGDALALKLCEDAAHAIAYGAVNLINAFNPSRLRISNDMAEGKDLLFPIIQADIKERILPEILEPLDLQMGNITDDPILYGAAAVAIDQCLKDPAILTDH